MEGTQPKINQRLIVRSAGFLFLLAAMFFGYSWLKNRGSDIDLGTVDSKDWIAAVEYMPNSGTRAVVIKPDGTVIPSPGYKDGSGDRDVTWRPDGNRVYFSSDRDQSVFNIYRWNLATGACERRTLGKIAKSDPTFPVGEEYKTTVDPLIVFGGMAWELSAADGKANQLVPPKEGKEVVDTRDENTTELGGGFGQGAATKIREARYIGGTSYVAAIRRTDDGEALFVQNLADPKDHHTLAAGDKIIMDVNPRNGVLFFSVMNFQWPDPNGIPAQFIKNGVAEKPFLHYMLYFDPAKGKMDAPPIIASQSDQSCFSQMAISPDGSTLICTIGPYKGNGDAETKAIVTMPAQSQAAGQAVKIYPSGKGFSDARITSLSWSADGKRIAFGTVGKDRHRALYVMDKDGGNLKQIAAGKGEFGLPKFSPQ